MERNDIFTAKLNKGDLIGAIDQSILEADQAKEIAQEALAALDKHQAEIKALLARARSKYAPL